MILGYVIELIEIYNFRIDHILQKSIFNDLIFWQNRSILASCQITKYRLLQNVITTTYPKIIEIDHVVLEKIVSIVCQFLQIIDFGDHTLTSKSLWGAKTYPTFFSVANFIK